MIDQTDIEAYYDTGVTAAVKLDFPCRIKGIEMGCDPTTVLYGGIDLHDGTSTSDPLLIRQYVGNLQGTDFPVLSYKIPGNGVRFSTSVFVAFPNVSSAGTTDLPGYYRLFYQK